MKYFLQIEGMTCSSCVHMIERTLNSKTGVEKAVVTLATNSGHVEFDPAILGPRDIIRIVEVRSLYFIGCCCCCLLIVVVLLLLLYRVLVSQPTCVLEQGAASLGSATTGPFASGGPPSSSP